MTTENTARLVIQCEDKPGIVSAVSTFLFNQGANINTLDQYSTDPKGGKFFMRLEFHSPHLSENMVLIKQAFQDTVADRFGMEWKLQSTARKQKAVILVSKHEHVLFELLWQYQQNELNMDIAKVISNHPDLEQSVNSFGIPFLCIPMNTKDKASTEAKILDALGSEIDLIILARYMQILSKDFVHQFKDKIINIHHSFLPAFIGADPYQQAHDRGVKVIGATAHYVTEQLDQGPIIAQDVEHVTHRDSAKDLKQKGRHIEQRVLSKAVKWHLESRVFVYNNRTLVFN